MIVDESLKFNLHVQSIVSMAYQRLGILFRRFTSRNPVLLTRAYTTFVRPILEYCSVVWSPYLLKDIDAIEDVQRYFTRRIFSHRSYSYSYHERLLLLCLESLEVRRLRFDLIMCFKIVHNLVDLDRLHFFIFRVILKLEVIPSNLLNHSIKTFNLITFSATVWLTVGILFQMILYHVHLYLNLKILLKYLILINF